MCIELDLHSVIFDRFFFCVVFVGKIIFDHSIITSVLEPNSSIL